MALRDKSSFESLPTTTKVLVLVATIALLGVGYYFALYSPLSDELAAADKQRKKLENDVQQAEMRRREFLRLSEELATREAADRLNNQILPEKAEIATFLQDLNRTAELSGLTMLLVEPRPEESGKQYVRMPVSLRLEGRYHQLAKFFYNVSRVDRAINMENISLVLTTASSTQMRAASRDADEGNAYRLKVDVLATTFRRVTEADIKPASPAQPGAATKGAKP